MKATIKITETATGAFVDEFNCDEEIEAQELFDVLTDGGSEWEGVYQYDLIAHAPSGECVRRTMYKPQGEPQLV